MSRVLSPPEASELPPCTHCGGVGRLTTGHVMDVEDCPRCHGTGRAKTFITPEIPPEVAEALAAHLDVVGAELTALRTLLESDPRGFRTMSVHLGPATWGTKAARIIDWIETWREELALILVTLHRTEGADAAIVALPVRKPGQRGRK